MMIIICAILGAVVLPVALVIKFACEMRMNNERIRRGESSKKYHDLTDQPAPVDVIVWKRQDRFGIMSVIFYGRMI